MKYAFASKRSSSEKNKIKRLGWPQLLSAVVIGVAIGILHGGLRAISVLHMSQKQDSSSCTILFTMGTQWRWQFMDGLYLLLIAGMLTAYMIMVIHF
jgi:hypothetical protein